METPVVLDLYLLCLKFLVGPILDLMSLGKAPLWTPLSAVVGGHLDLRGSGWNLGLGRAASYSLRESNLLRGNRDRPAVLGSG